MGDLDKYIRNTNIEFDEKSKMIRMDIFAHTFRVCVCFIHVKIYFLCTNIIESKEKKYRNVQLHVIYGSLTENTILIIILSIFQRLHCIITFLLCSFVGEQQHNGNVTVVILTQILYLHSDDLRLKSIPMP